MRHREVRFTWEYWLNGEDKKSLKTLVWGKIDGQSFLPLYETDRTGKKESINPNYIKRISAIRVMLFSSCSFQLSNLELSDEGRYEIRLDLGKGKTQLRSSVNLSIDGKGTRNMSSCNAWNSQQLSVTSWGVTGSQSELAYIYNWRAITKASKVGFPNSHSFSVTWGAVFHSVCQVKVAWPTQVFSLHLATAHDCDTGLFG